MKEQQHIDDEIVQHFAKKIIARQLACSGSARQESSQSLVSLIDI